MAFKKFIFKLVKKISKTIKMKGKKQNFQSRKKKSNPNKSHIMI